MHFIFEIWNYLTSIFPHQFLKCTSLNTLGLQRSHSEAIFFSFSTINLEFSCGFAHSGTCMLLWAEQCMQSELCLNTVERRILCICPMGSNYRGIFTVQTCAAPLWNYAVFNRPENFSFLTCGWGMQLAVSFASPASTKKVHYAELDRIFCGIPPSVPCPLSII